MFLLAVVSIFACTGCPQLNYWDGPSTDPFFRVADPVEGPPVRSIAEPPTERIG